MALDPINKLRQEAAAAVPTGHYRLTGTDRLRADDLVWSWTTKEWLRADSPEWTVATPFGAGAKMQEHRTGDFAPINL